MFSENQDPNGENLVSISKETLMEMFRRLSGFQNIGLVLQEKDIEIKTLRQSVISLKAKLQDLQKVVSGFEQHQSLSTSVEADFNPPSGIHHRSSAPEIFLYPDITKKSDLSNNKPESLAARGIGSVRVCQSQEQKSSQVLQEPHKSTELINKAELNNKPSELNNKLASTDLGTAMKMDFRLGAATNLDYTSSGCIGGVSEVYFNNVVSELVKTKQYLYNLQKQTENKVTPQVTTQVQDGLHQEITTLQQKVKELQLENEQIQRENVVLKMHNDVAVKSGKTLNDSFELDHTKVVEKTTQTEFQLISPEVQKLKSEIARLTREKSELIKEKESCLCPADVQTILRENENLQKRLEQKIILYHQQKDSNKILSTCLQEEKERYKKLESNYKRKMEESHTLLDRIAHIRQKHEELRQEKNALEKALALNDWNPAHSYKSDASDASKRGHNRHPSNTSVSSTGSDYAIAPARIQPDSGSFEEYGCPTCQQTFSIEKEYQIHIAKCCVD